MPWQPAVNSKTPPGLGPEVQWQYPFRRYAKDTILWSISTDVPASQQGGSAVLQLFGGARTLADQIPVTEIQNGLNADWHDGHGLCHHAGILCLLRRLAERFGELEIETILRSLLEFFLFRRQPNEDIDQCLTRFDIAYTNAVDHASVGLSPSVLAFFLLKGLAVAPTRWPLLFIGWGGSFPTTDAHIRDLKSALRQQSHMYEQHPTGLSTLGHTVFTLSHPRPHCLHPLVPRATQ